MNSLLLYLLFPLVLLFGSGKVHSQPECKVLMEEIADEYQGDCRRGLAHGIGIASGVDHYEGRFRRGLPHGAGKYTWKNGDVYSGRWRNGEKHGEGVFFDAEKDSTFAAVWRRGEIFRKLDSPDDKPPYVVQYSRNVTRHRILRVGDGDRVFFAVGEPMRGRRISHLSVFGSSGNYIELRNMVGFENVAFPFQGKIVFYAPSRTGLVTYQIEFMFEINEPGNWEVILHF